MRAENSRLRRWGNTGIPLLAARLIVGAMFVWMGLAKTGLPQTILNRTGTMDSPVVQRVLNLGIVELSGPVDFLKLIREYKLFPDRAWPLLNLTAVVLPWVEVICGLFLLLGVGVRGSSLTLVLLLTFFTIVVAWRAIDIYQQGGIAFCAIKFDCGCGAGVVLICSKLVENIVLILLSLGILLSRSRRFCLRKNLIPARVAVPSAS